jgi:hypothetical protein
MIEYFVLICTIAAGGERDARTGEGAKKDG